MYHDVAIYVSICYYIATGNITFNHNNDKSLMFKYGRMQKKTVSWLACGSLGAWLDCMLPGVQVTTGLGFFCVHVVYVSEDCDSLLYQSMNYMSS